MQREDIVARIDVITNELTQMRANYAKLEGHLGEAQYWLVVMDSVGDAAQELIEENELMLDEVATDAC